MIAKVNKLAWNLADHLSVLSKVDEDLWTLCKLYMKV